MRYATLGIVTAATLAVAACGYTPAQRGVSGAAIGAGAGAVGSAAVGGDPVGGALLGGAAGAAIGALTADPYPRYRGGRRYYDDRGYRGDRRRHRRHDHW